MPLRLRTPALPARGGRPLPQLYVKAPRGLPAVRAGYATDLIDHPHGSRLKWLVSTLLAAVVGLSAIGFMLFSSLDGDGKDGIFKQLERAGTAALEPLRLKGLGSGGGAAGKSDRLQASAQGSATVFVIHERQTELLDKQKFIAIKPYARVISSLAMTIPEKANIPAFNPFSLFTARSAASGATDGAAASSGKVDAKLSDFDGGLVPTDDGEQLDSAEVAAIVAKARGELQAGDQAPMDGGGAEAEAGGEGQAGPGAPSADGQAIPAGTAVIAKNIFENDSEAADNAQQDVRVVRAAGGERLADLLAATGAESWQARDIVEQAKPILKKDRLDAGEEVRMTLQPSPGDDNHLDIVSASVFSAGQEHLVSVALNDSGQYTASAKPPANTLSLNTGDGGNARPSLYAAIYYVGQQLGFESGVIEQMLHTHAYDSDYKRKVTASDEIELFYDLTDDGKGGEGKPAELLFSALNVGGVVHRFYRFRTPDGIVDYYDEAGSDSKRFLVRKPVRGGDEVHFTSGYGMRFHPLLHINRMHTGIDWAGPSGTPIFAAGNGVIEEAGRKGGNGNYIRIRHANGYQTAYSHMSKFANGMVPGIKVSQGQIIGYVGSTGLSSGPHLHFEVLINNAFVDPMTIQVPREKQLKGKQLADFQKERARIEDLMRKAPDSTHGLVMASSG